MNRNALTKTNVIRDCRYLCYTIACSLKNHSIRTILNLRIFSLSLSIISVQFGNIIYSILFVRETTNFQTLLTCAASIPFYSLMSYNVDAVVILTFITHCNSNSVLKHENKFIHFCIDKNLLLFI